MNISRNSLDSTVSREESNSRVNLNNAMLLSIDDEILSNFGDSVFSLSNEETKTDTSTSIDVEQSKYFSCSLEHRDSTNLISSSFTKSHLNCKNNDYADNSIQNSSNFEYSQNKDMEQENNVTKRHIPLKTLLRRMFDEILGKCSNCIKQPHSTCSNKHLSNECLINSSNSPNRSNNTFEINNNDSCLTQKCNNMIVTTIDNVIDTDQIKASSSDNISVCLSNRFTSNKLITILEDSNESTSNSQLKDSFNWSANCIAKLSNFSFKKFESTGNEDNSSYSEYVESDDTSRFSFSSETDSVELSTVNYNAYNQLDNTINSTINRKIKTEYIKNTKNAPLQELKDNKHNPPAVIVNNVPVQSPNMMKGTNKKVTKKSPVIKKNTKKRSISLTENNIKEQNMGFDKKDQQENYSQTYSAKNNSFCIIVSPIKPVKYLRNFFTNIEKKNKRNIKLSPIMYKLRRPKIPYIFITPATPN